LNNDSTTERDKKLDSIALEFASKIITLSHYDQLWIESKIRKALGCEPQRAKVVLPKAFTGKELAILFYGHDLSDIEPWWSKLAEVINRRLLVEK
jgi:hypothetical protein